MTSAVSTGDGLGSLGDVTFAGKPSTTVVAAVALAPLLAGTAQFPVQHATLNPVAPDISIDRLVADGKLAGELKVARDLFRAPLLPEQRNHRTEVTFAEPPVAPGSRAAVPGAARCLARAIIAVVAAITLEFPANRAPVAPQVLGNLGLIQSLLSQGRNNISFF